MLLFYCFCFCFSIAYLTNCSVIYSLIASIIFHLLITRILSNFFSINLAYIDSGFNDENPIKQCYVIGCSVLKSKLDPNLITKKLIEGLKDSDYYLKLKKILKSKFLIEYWTLSQNFNIHDHVEVITIPTKAKLFEFISTQISIKVMPSNKPNWKIFLVENFENNQSVLIWQINHSYGDGLSLMSCFLNLSSAENVKFIQLPKISTLYFYLLYPLGPIKSLRWVFNLLFRDKRDDNKFNEKELTGKKTVFCSEPLDFTICKEFAKKNSVSLNDVLLTLLIRTFQNYHLKTFGEPLKEFKLFIPSSLRRNSSFLDKVPVDNNSNFVIFDTLPSSDLDFNEALQVIHLMTSNMLKKSLDFYYRGIGFILSYSLIPKSLNLILVSIITKLISCAFTNVPGPLETIKMFNISVNDLFFFAGRLGDSGMITNILSYDGKLYFCCQADEGVRVNVKELVKVFEDLGRKEIGMGRKLK